jgi:Holliday junction resolvase-like predicted endonuclease
VIIDLIFVDGDTLISQKSKKSIPRQKLQALSQKQQLRIYQTASEFLTKTNRPFASEMRFGVALVDIHGDIKVLVNALMH